jgi:hypothetical protein
MRSFPPATLSVDSMHGMHARAHLLQAQGLVWDESLQHAGASHCVVWEEA